MIFLNDIVYEYIYTYIHIVVTYMFDIFQQIPGDVIIQAEARVDKNCDNIYFPLNNADNKVDGFKVINSIYGRESTVPVTGCSGVAAIKKNTKTKSAVLVLSIKDFLALHTQKINSM